MDELRKAFLGKTLEIVLACGWFPLGLSSLDGLTRAGTPGHKGIRVTSLVLRGFPGSSAGKESTCNAGDPGLIPVLGRSTGEGKGYPLQYCGLENSMDCIVHGVAKSRTRLSDFHF